jgi:hypothetical protein
VLFAPEDKYVWQPIIDYSVCHSGNAGKLFVQQPIKPKSNGKIY